MSSFFDDDFDLSDISGGGKSFSNDLSPSHMELVTPLSSLLSTNNNDNGGGEDASSTSRRKRKKRHTSVGRSVLSANEASRRRKSTVLNTPHPQTTGSLIRRPKSASIPRKSTSKSRNRSLFFLDTDSEVSASEKRPIASRERMLTLSQPRKHKRIVDPECTFKPHINNSIDVDSMSLYDLSVGDAKRIESKLEKARTQQREKEDNEFRMFRRKQRELIQSLSDSSGKWFDSKRKHELFKAYKHEKVERKIRRLKREKEEKEEKELTFQPQKAKPVPGFMARVAEMRKKYNPRNKFERDRPTWRWS
mmetsp:Transcript_9323/g.34500  ORF Transcript_9323/g.34500 Transcript_9323/m.34500 type:complete len:306 (+) Transcript_9323:2746-3663(+)